AVASQKQEVFAPVGPPRLGLAARRTCPARLAHKRQHTGHIPSVSCLHAARCLILNRQHAKEGGYIGPPLRSRCYGCWTRRTPSTANRPDVDRIAIGSHTGPGTSPSRTVTVVLPTSTQPAARSVNS